MSTEQLQKLVQAATGPAPWYWETFPQVHGRASRQYEWRFHGRQGDLAYLVSLHAAGEPSRPRLALNTYCRPFLFGEGMLGVWCPEGRNLRFVGFDVDRLQSFSFEEIVGWFKNSGERIYAATPPIGEFEIGASIPAGTYSLDVPEPFTNVDELLVPTSYKALEKNDPSAAIYVVYPHGKLCEVLPQNWITTATYDPGNHWITRATRDPETHRIIGELARVGPFELAENGRDFERWL